jgi:hypothetical protein
MGMEDIRKLRAGQCGSCGLRMFFWGKDGSKSTCVGWGLTHEVESDETLYLTANEKTEAVLLVAVEKEETKTN